MASFSSINSDDELFLYPHDTDDDDADDCELFRINSCTVYLMSVSWQCCDCINSKWWRWWRWCRCVRFRDNNNPKHTRTHTRHSPTKMLGVNSHFVRCHSSIVPIGILTPYASHFILYFERLDERFFAFGGGGVIQSNGSMHIAARCESWC